MQVSQAYNVNVKLISLGESLQECFEFFKLTKAIVG